LYVINASIEYNSTF